MKKVFVPLLAIMLVFAPLCSCSVPEDTGEATDSTATSINVPAEIRNYLDGDFYVSDNKTVYSNDVDDSVKYLYLTVSRGNSSENTDHTWAEINTYSIFDYLKMGTDRYMVEGLLQEGDENGPFEEGLGYGTSVPNATVKVRGNTTSNSQQKSYKVELKKGMGFWENQRTLNLNKHPYDNSMLRNKLAYDLVEEIPGMIGCRTQFVRLYVRDLTAESSGNAAFVDYGLYTHVEQINQRYLRSHGLDENGHLYKAEMFEFARYEDAIKLETDPSFDRLAFNEVVESKGNSDHTKLINMLEELNDYSNDIKTVFEKYFDAENYFTYLAFQILVGNSDSTNRNFFIYSPQNSNKFYFIPWDIDRAFLRNENIVMDGWTEENMGHDVGLSNYWCTNLVVRVFSIKEYRDMLCEKIEEMHKIITPEKIASMTETYKSVTAEFINRMPDIGFRPYVADEYDRLLSLFTDEVNINYELFYESLKKPMPFFIGVPFYNEDGSLTFMWEPSFSFDGKDITYTVELADNLEFTEPLMYLTGMRLLISDLPDLPPGQYFLRVTATDESGARQRSVDYYTDAEHSNHYGVICFYIFADGTIEQAVRNE